MVEFAREEYTVNGSTYVVTKGNIIGSEAVVAVTNLDEDIHYISKEFDAASDDIFTTKTIPPGRGIPDDIRHGVSIDKMSDIYAAISANDEKNIKGSLEELGQEVLASHTTNNDNRDDTETAIRKSKIYDHRASPKDFLN
jgi:hypothetical protein